MSFSTLGLASSLLETLAALGYAEPTPVQMSAIPAALAGGDLLVSSRTGSGKTAAFLLPALARLEASFAQGDIRPTRRGRALPRMLVLAPTRELALQVQKSAHAYGRGQRLRTACLVGGMSYGMQLKSLERPVDIAIATPGRLRDHMERGSVDLSQVEMLVLDEADRMLDMGFQEELDAIIAALPENRQTMLFSATLDGVVGKLARRVTRDAKRIDIAAVAAEPSKIEQRALFADNFEHKSKLLEALLGDASLEQAVIFTSTKRSAEELSGELTVRGIAASALHGDMRQHERNRTLTQMREGRVRVLVATDVAARGIDVPGITHVINFDAPREPESYVHRIGRTGRAGRSGLAVTLLNHAERHLLRNIERYTGAPMEIATIPGLEPRARPAAPRKLHVKPGPRRPAGSTYGRPAGGPASGRTAGAGFERPAHGKPGGRTFKGDRNGFNNDRKRTGY